MRLSRFEKRVGPKPPNKLKKKVMHMKTPKLILASIALGALTLSASAQPTGSPQDGPPPGRGQGQGQGRHHRMPPPIIAALDANHDGAISADEIANASAALKTLDKNGDGQLTKDEYTPQRPGQPGAPEGRHDGPPNGQGGGDHPKRPVPPVDAALDLNGDGVISADEIAKAPASLLTLDKNNDGQLTREELMPPPPESGNGGPGNGNGQMPPPGEEQGGANNGQRPPPPQQ